MKAYKFTTKVSENGTIQIPFNPSLFEEEVEVIILSKSKGKKEKMKANDFVNKWAGFLKNIDTDKAKYEYLSNKYK